MNFLSVLKTHAHFCSHPFKWSFQFGVPNLNGDEKTEQWANAQRLLGANWTYCRLTLNASGERKTVNDKRTLTARWAHGKRTQEWTCQDLQNSFRKISFRLKLKIWKSFQTRSKNCLNMRWSRFVVYLEKLIANELILKQLMWKSNLIKHVYMSNCLISTLGTCIFKQNIVYWNRTKH